MSWPLNRIQHFFSVLTARFVNLGPAAEGNNNGLIELARQTDPILCFGRHALVSVRHSRRKSVEQKARRQVTGLIWGGKGSNLLVPTARWRQHPRGHPCVSSLSTPSLVSSFARRLIMPSRGQGLASGLRSEHPEDLLQCPY